jgi:adenylate cyclase
VALYGVIAHRGMLEPLELRAQDLFFQLRNRVRPPLPPADLVIVAIDKPSLDEIGQWPFPRPLHADLVAALHAAGAELIAFDVIFDTPTEEAADRRFADAIRRAGSVVLAENFEVIEEGAFTQTVWARPIEPLLEAAAASAAVTVPLDGDGAVRRAPLAVQGVPAFARAVAELWLRRHGRAVDADPRRTFASPVPADQPLRVNFLGAPRTVRTVSYYQALDPARMLPPGIFAGKLVMIGASLSGVAGLDQIDAFDYPFRAWAAMPLPGVELHASIVDTLLRRRYLVPLPRLAEWTLFLLALALGAALMLAVREWWATPLFLLLAGLYGLGAFLLFLLASRLALVATPLAALGAFLLAERVWQLAVADREKRYLQRAFKHYVAPAVVDRIVDDPSQLELNGAWYETTVVFTDLVGFTSLAERMEPMRMRAILTGYFSEMVDIMLAHQGTLDKFIGDAMMCFFGVPVRTPEHARQAAATACEMLARLADLNRRWQRQGLTPLAMRIGVNSGRVVAGNMGTATLFNYTIMGDCVNLGSRLEGANKFYGTSILLGEATQALLDGAFQTRRLDRIRVKGKENALTVYELVGARGAVGGSRAEQLAIYEQALDLYFAQRFAEASRRLAEALRMGADAPSEVLLARCRELAAAPPGESWDGVYVLQSK